MASCIPKTEDPAALPTALLALAKQHMRIDGAHEDEFVKSTVARAIDWFERVTNVTVDPTEYEWKPDAANFCDNVAKFTETPVRELVAMVGADDVSAQYAVSTMSTKGVGLYSLNGAFASGLVLTFKSGYADAAAVPGGVLDAVLRYAAHLYEHREILVPGAQETAPGWMTDVIATFWMPRA